MDETIIRHAGRPKVLEDRSAPITIYLNQSTFALVEENRKNISRNEYIRVLVEGYVKSNTFEQNILTQLLESKKTINELVFKIDEQTKIIKRLEEKINAIYGDVKSSDDSLYETILEKHSKKVAEIIHHDANLRNQPTEYAFSYFGHTWLNMVNQELTESGCKKHVTKPVFIKNVEKLKNG